MKNLGSFLTFSLFFANFAPLREIYVYSRKGAKFAKTKALRKKSGRNRFVSRETELNCRKSFGAFEKIPSLV